VQRRLQTTLREQEEGRLARLRGQLLQLTVAQDAQVPPLSFRLQTIRVKPVS